MRTRFLLGAVFLVLSLFTSPLFGQVPAEYRAYWVETFNTAMTTTTDIDRIISSCTSSNCNAIFAQVRRRGDSWYLDSLEPPNRVFTIDPLAYLIQQAHSRGIEIHAFVIVGSIHNSLFAPVNPPNPTLPATPVHVFKTHFLNSAGALRSHLDPEMWATRALPHNLAGTSSNGQRFGAEWYIDLGHPAAAEYTVNVLTHLVTKYPVDGVHLDRIRYPEAPIDPGRGINVGYNETSVNRFRKRHGSAAGFYPITDTLRGGYPMTTDALWNQWRRDQVTNFVRRLYLSVTAVKPQIKVSAALICFWTGPVGSGGWANTEASYRVFQDWRAWAQEGILDIIAPMAYKREHATTERAQYDDWMTFSKQLAVDTGRHSLIGLGAYLNGIEGTLLQARRALDRPDTTPGTPLNSADGVIFYALGNAAPGSTLGSTNAAVTNNPYSFPSQSTPKRLNVEFFSALLTGVSVNAATDYESAAPPLFDLPAPVPAMPWKSATGHLRGFANGAEGVLDAAAVWIENLDGSRVRTSLTDGQGFFGGAGLAPGSYRIRVALGTESLWALPDVTAGRVSDVEVTPDRVLPTIEVGYPASGSSFVYLQEVAAPQFQCDDALSGIATCTAGAFDTQFVGNRSFDVNASDRAGNLSSLSVPYVVDRAATAIALTYEENRNRMTLIAQVSVVAPGGGTPQGIVEFVDRNHDSLGTAPLIDGVARLEVQKRSLHLVVGYSGNDNYLPAQTDEIHVIPRAQ